MLMSVLYEFLKFGSNRKCISIENLSQNVSAHFDLCDLETLVKKYVKSDEPSFNICEDTTKLLQNKMYTRQIFEFKAPAVLRVLTNHSHLYTHGVSYH